MSHVNRSYAIKYAGACPYCWPGHDPENVACPANFPENISTDPEAIRAGTQYELMLCDCQPKGGFAPIHEECARSMDSYMEFCAEEERNERAHLKGNQAQ